ncbi:MAG: hypothetical protein KGH64_02915 [Candidatus Micrarchaeota archaeon]|nr:hypothetical protein [Candidatus Micrarchaeota archaeon]
MKSHELAKLLLSMPDKEVVYHSFFETYEEPFDSVFEEKADILEWNPVTKKWENRFTDAIVLRDKASR